MCSRGIFMLHIYRGDFNGAAHEKDGRHSRCVIMRNNFGSSPVHYYYLLLLIKV